MKMQRVTESLVAAKLSRNLELPRIETDGRFARAIRLAEQDGTYRQKLEAHYESIWTAFWWFDDIAYLNGRYDEFANLVSDTDHAINLEFLCNLVQLLFNSVIHQHLTVEEARLEERASRLTERLKVIAENKERPNNALEALSSLLVVEVNQAILKQDTEKLSSLWPQFSDVVKRARGLGEFSAERLTKMIEVFGLVAGKDSSYVQLVDEVAAFVSERTGEAQGALVLLKRAQQLDFEDNFEIIRLLGKAARQLTKKRICRFSDRSTATAHVLLIVVPDCSGLRGLHAFLQWLRCSSKPRRTVTFRLRSYPWLWPSLGLLSNFGIFQTLSKLFG